MDDLTTNSAPAVEDELLAPEVVPYDAPQIDEPELEVEAEEGQPTAEEFDEIEYGGKKYSIPKDLKPGFMFQADYTKKTTEVAEIRKGLDTERQTFAQQQAAIEQHIVGVGKLVALDDELQRYSKVDWKAWSQTDPQAVQQAWIAKEQLTQNRNELAGKLHEEWQRSETQKQQETAKQIAEGQAVLAKEIPNWSPDLAKELSQYGKSQGLSDKRLSGMAEPAEVKILHKARMYDQLVAKQRAAAGKPAVVAQPVTQVGARRSPASNEPKDSDPPEVWLAKRYAQLAKQSVRR